MLPILCTFFTSLMALDVGGFQGRISAASRPVSSIVPWTIAAISVASIERSISVAAIATAIAQATEAIAIAVAQASVVAAAVAHGVRGVEFGLLFKARS